LQKELDKLKSKSRFDFIGLAIAASRRAKKIHEIQARLDQNSKALELGLSSQTKSVHALSQKNVNYLLILS